MSFSVICWIKASEPQRLKVSSLQVASAGDAKRKQSARPSGGWARACRIRPVPNPSLPFPTSPRVSLRGHPLHPVFFRLFFGLQFFFPKSFPKPFQGASLGSQNHEKPNFFLPKPSQGPSFFRFSVDLCFYHFLDDFLVIFSGKNDTKNDASFHSGAFFFGTADPYDSIVFTIRKLLFQFWPFWRFSLKMP